MKQSIFSELLLAMVLVVLIGAFAGGALGHIHEPARLWSIVLSLLLAVVASALLAHAWNRRLAQIAEVARGLAPNGNSARIAEHDSGGVDAEVSELEVGKGGSIEAGAGKSAAINGEIQPTGRGEFAVVANVLGEASIRVAGVFQELENSRKEMETALNSMEEAVITVNAQSRVHWTNRVMVRLAGAPIRPGSALVETVRDPDLLASVAQALGQRVTANARAKAVVPGRIFDVSAAPMPGGGAVVVLHDVTEVDRVEKTRRDFIANVSHELRTPLTSISGYAETLLEDGNGLTPQARDFLSVIGRNAARMTRLTEDLLALARIESGEHKLNRRSIAAGLLMDDAFDAMSGLLMDHGIVLERPETAPVMVMADTDAILQVLSNLLENAVKYGEGSRVILGSRVLGDSVEFYVRDFGAGIASEHLGRIFERFYRIDKDRSRESGGTGLGLSIVKHIVLAHGGTVRAESDLDRGSTFFFTLPLA